MCKRSPIKHRLIPTRSGQVQPVTYDVETYGTAGDLTG